MAQDTNPDYEEGTTPTKLEDLYDVVVTSPASPSLLVHRNGAYENLTPAANPGTATSTDAAVINALITACRNAGICL